MSAKVEEVACLAQFGHTRCRGRVAVPASTRAGDRVAVPANSRGVLPGPLG